VAVAPRRPRALEESLRSLQAGSGRRWIPPKKFFYSSCILGEGMTAQENIPAVGSTKACKGFLALYVDIRPYRHRESPALTFSRRILAR
jgi:hypothetical protein